MLPTIWDTIPAAGDSRECFSDEVAIDFPSVDDVVARLRDAFLGDEAGAETTGALETPATLTTEVSLSRRDATMGTVVPLDVPVRGTCAPCGGRGEIWTEPCPECSGRGDRVVRHPLRVAVPPGVVDGARFRFRVNSPGAKPVRVEVLVAIRSSAA
jgi:hypothetical protein